MTTILGIQGNGFAVLCSESGLSDDTGSTAYTIAQPKISPNGNYLIGVAGDGRAANLIDYVFVPPVAGSKLRGKKLDQFMTAKFIPALRECFETNGYATPAENAPHIARQESFIMVAVNGFIYVIEENYDWAPLASGLYVIGSGKDYALGALQALMPKRTPSINQCKVIALRAVTIAAKLDQGSGLPCHVFTQTTS